jgi:hypothetical protein
MKKLIISVTAIVLFLFSPVPTQATEGYYTHGWTPYPPSCVYSLNAAYDPRSQGEPQLLVSETITLGSADNTSPDVSVEIEVTRRACMEENRSALFMLLRNPSESPYRAPKISARIGENSYPLRLTREPNTRVEDYASKTLDKTIGFVIDGADSSVIAIENAVSADQYNGAFKLVVEDTGSTGNVYEYDLPANNPALKPKRKLLNGRMSGTWIAEGTSDQGFQLSIQELWINESPTPHAFLSWYTFDNEGKPLWLTGAGTFGVMGDNGVFLEMELVTNGEFMGSKAADRQPLPEAYLVVENCNRLGFRYNLEELGLGRGNIYIKRLFSLETAGYACRDIQSRLDTISD